MTRIALVGAGSIAQVHAEAVAALPRTRLQAVVDPNLEAASRLAGQWKAPDVFSSVEELIAADKFDRAHVLVPPDLHRSVALPILHAGKPVLLEKPLAATAEECRALLAAAAGSAVLGVNQNFVFHPAFMRLRQSVDARKLGKPHFVNCIYNVPLRQLATGQFGHWMFHAPGNILLEQAVHPLSQVAALAGDITDTQVMPGPALELAPGVPFYSTMSLSLQCRHMPSQLWFAVGQPFPFWQVTVVCDDGVLVADILSNRMYSVARTRWSEGIDRFLSGHLSAGGVVRSSWRDFIGYGLSTLGVKGRATPFAQSIRTSVAKFHAALDAGKTPELDGQFGTALVTACERARDQLPGLESKVRAPTSVVHAPAADEPVTDVAVIGGTGFIGGHLVRNLVARGLRVTVVARNVANLPAVFHDDKIALRPADIRNKDQLAKAIGAPKHVINLAHGGGGRSWEEIRDGMVGGAENVAAACRTAGVERLIHVGSIASLYLGPQSGTVTGATPPDTEADSRADYARAKAVSDRLLLDFHAQQNLPVVLLRPGLVVGKGTSPFHTGVGFYNNEQHCIGWNHGENPLPFILVEDVAEAIAQALFVDNVIGRSFNLVGDVRPTARTYIAELARAIERPLRFHGKVPRELWSEEMMKWGIKRVAGRRAPIPSYHDLLSRGLMAQFDCNDAKQALNWSPVDSADEFWRRAVLIHTMS